MRASIEPATGVHPHGRLKEFPPQPAPTPCRECSRPVAPFWRCGYGANHGAWIENDLCDLCTEALWERIERSGRESQAASRLKQSGIPAKMRGWDLARAEAEARNIKRGEDLEQWLAAKGRGE